MVYLCVQRIERNQNHQGSHWRRVRESHDRETEEQISEARLSYMQPVSIFVIQKSELSRDRVSCWILLEVTTYWYWINNISVWIQAGLTTDKLSPFGCCNYSLWVALYSSTSVLIPWLRDWCVVYSSYLFGDNIIEAILLSCHIVVLPLMIALCCLAIYLDLPIHVHTSVILMT